MKDDNVLPFSWAHSQLSGFFRSLQEPCRFVLPVLSRETIAKLFHGFAALALCLCAFTCNIEFIFLSGEPDRAELPVFPGAFHLGSVVGGFTIERYDGCLRG